MKPNVPEWMNTRARSSLFSVYALRMSLRSTASTTSRGTAATSATINQGRFLTR